MSGEAKAALRKLVRALPDTFRATAEAAVGATVIDATGWGDRDHRPPDHLAVLREAVVGRRKVVLTYTARSRDRTERLIDPWGLVVKDDTWYLVAGTDRGPRTFRVDRIVDAAITAEPAERPDDFSLAAAWEHVVDEVERRRAGTWATLVTEERYVSILRDQFGRHVHAEDVQADGRVRVHVAAPTPLDLARTLAGWGSLVEVVDPASVRTELARIGAELAGQYAPM